MIVELISVGTELLLGNIVNTNAQYIAEQCAGLGLSMYYQITVGDNRERLKEAVLTAKKRSDIVIITGGLGPTEDDLTKETVADALGLPLVSDEATKKRIEKYFKERKIKNITENNWKQAEIIKSSLVLENGNGTAPGLVIEEKEGGTFILLPGPPEELIPMFEKKVGPYLRKKQPYVLCSRMIKLCGIGESMVEMKIKDLIQKQENPTIAPYAKTGEVHIRVTAFAKEEGEAKRLLKPVVKEIKERLEDYIYTTDSEITLEECVVRLLKKNELTIATAESCTGGLLAGRLVNVVGVSDVFKEGFITYSNRAKRKYLDVSKSVLKEYGAVSEKTAKEMAKGAAMNTGADISLAVTGIAGPDGGTEEKPVGLVYIACYANEKVTVQEYHFNGNREKIRESTVAAALDLVRKCLLAGSSKTE